MKRLVVLALVTVGCAAQHAQEQKSGAPPPQAPAPSPASAAPAGVKSEQTGDEGGALNGPATGSGAAATQPPPATATTPAAKEPPKAATKKPSPAPKSGAAGGMIVGPNDVAQAQIAFDDASKAFAASGTDCLQMCKALQSMTNATDHLCDLVVGSTSDQKRCTDARAKLETAKAKVKATCGGCNG